MNSIEKIDAENDQRNEQSDNQSETNQSELKQYNDSQRVMINQFMELHSMLIRNEFNCPVGTELLVTTLLAHSFSESSVESIMRKTGFAHEELIKRVICLENNGIVVCNDNEVQFTENGRERLNSVSDKALQMFLRFADKVKSEDYFSG